MSGILKKNGRSMFTDLNIGRKKFLKLLGGVGISLLGGVSIFKVLKNSKSFPFKGKIHGANYKFGHLLREAISEQPEEQESIDTLIIGGGISGLSAGWWFQKNNYQNYKILEMEDHTGGNSSSGENDVSKYPWGAHYVPLPGKSAEYVRDLFQELGIINGYKNNKPIYDEYFLCADPHDRLFFQGRWQEGLVPSGGVSENETLEYSQFFEFISILKQKIGNDGKPIFNIPLELSSRDPEYLQLDTISMSDFMKSRGWTSKHLLWYVNYCCRDDYGVSLENVSAWAGLHYFASRVGEGMNTDSQSVVTWPEGNGWLSNQLSKINSGKIQTNTLVYKIHFRDTDGYGVDTISPSGAKKRYLVNHIIFAGPRYSASRVIEGYDLKYHEDLLFSPWLIANITLSERPGGKGAPLSWDNVSFYSESLGYIFANHQDLTFNRRSGVITYYLPLDENRPLDKDSLKEIRKNVLQKKYEDWIELILPDLEKMHPGISDFILSIDLWIWGHGMVSPGIDYLWNSKRSKMLEPFRGIEFAHSDMSGISVFEEAQYRGCEAAKKILRKIKV